MYITSLLQPMNPLNKLSLRTPWGSIDPRLKNLCHKRLKNKMKFLVLLILAMLFSGLNPFLLKVISIQLNNGSRYERRWQGYDHQKVHQHQGPNRRRCWSWRRRQAQDHRQETFPSDGRQGQAGQPGQDH